MRPLNVLTATLVVASFTVAAAASAGTLEDVKARGVLRCVVSTGIAGFAYPDANGVWKGFDIDFCRATAAAVLGDASKIKAVTSTGKTRFTLLNSGEGDVLWRNTTVTFSRDVGVKLRFHGINYYDGQGFMVSKELGVSSAKELDGASVCIQTGTTTELNLADYFHANGMKYEAVTIETNDEEPAELHCWAVRRLHHRRLGPGLDPVDVHGSGESHHPARDHLEGAPRSGHPSR